MILFENFKSFLQLVVGNSQTVSQNSVLQDEDYAQAVSDHISALTPDQNIRLDSTMVPEGGSTGLLVNDELKREIRFEWKGAERLHGWIRPLFQNQGNVGSKFTKIWVRSDDSVGTDTTVPYGTLSDGRRYYVTDEDHGVFYLNEHGQVLGAVPGFSASPAVLPDYGVPSSAITFTVGLVEYVAVVSSVDHILAIYDTSTFALISSFGTSGTPGLPGADGLSAPVDIAVDETNSILYIACAEGIAPGSSGTGFVASFDLAVPATPTFVDYVAYDEGNGTLPQGETTIPVSIFYDGTSSSLWILNDLTTSAGTPYPAGFPYLEAGALSVSATGTSDGFLTAHIDGRTEDYWLRQQDTKLHMDVDRRKLYVGNVGGVEAFDASTLKHQLHFGYYSGDSGLVGGASISPLVPPAAFSSVNAANAVAADVLSVDGALRNLILFTDGINNRFVRVPEDAYLGDNVVTFSEITFSVPLSLHGYLVKGTIPTSKVCIEYRTISTGSWQRLAQTDSVPASSYFQFRVRVTPDLIDIIEEKSISEIVIVGEQE